MGKKVKETQTASPLSSDESLKKFMAISQAVQSGREISEEDGKFLMEHIPQSDAELVALRQQMDIAQQKGIIPKELDEQVAFKAMEQYMQSPAYKEHLAGMVADQKAGKLGDRLSGVLNIALSGGDIAQSINQISQSKNALAKSVRPGRPAPISSDQNLQQALRQGQEGTYDVSKQLAPAQAAANDQYLEDIQNAKTASAGQSGAFGAYTQAAANRRNRAGLEQSALGSQIMQQNRQNYQGLLGLKQQENQNIFNSRNANYGTDMQQYQYEQQAAANLGRVGYENLNRGVNSLASAGQNFAVDQVRQRQLQMLHNNMDKYGHGATATNAVNQLAKNYYDSAYKDYGVPLSTVDDIKGY
jgi:hypothetical protein